MSAQRSPKKPCLEAEMAKPSKRETEGATPTSPLGDERSEMQSLRQMVLAANTFSPPLDNLSESSSSEEAVVGGGGIKTRKKLIQIAAAETSAVSTSRSIEEEAFYHGFMSHDECYAFLRYAGDFLIRRTEFGGGRRPYVISVLSDSKLVRNFIVKTTRSKNLFYVYAYAFKSVTDLVTFHQRYKKPLNKNGLCIRRPVSKSSFQLYHEQITKTRKLTEGSFGTVYEGTLNLGVFRGRVEVAVKEIHRGTLISMDERLRLLREANFLRKLSHPNILKLYGVATAVDPVLVVLEFARNGNLLEKVKSDNPPGDSEKMKYIADIASGMAYLEGKNIIHKEVQARNILLGKDDSAKVSNFGLSLTRTKCKERPVEELPIRWISPEIFKQGTYTSKSDVWSFGVAIYEVFTNGKTPYEELFSLKQIRSGVLNQTLHLDLPEDAPKEIANVFSMCLKFSADDRPTFADLDKQLSVLRPKKYKLLTFFK